MQIECRGDEVIVHVNGTLVNHGSKSTATSGRIALQAEGSKSNSARWNSPSCLRNRNSVKRHRKTCAGQGQRIKKHRIYRKAAAAAKQIIHGCA
jgi:hypothetical protein